MAYKFVSTTAFPVPALLICGSDLGGPLTLIAQWFNGAGRTKSGAGLTHLSR